MFQHGMEESFKPAVAVSEPNLMRTVTFMCNFIRPHTVCQIVCVLLHTEYQNPHSAIKVRTV